MKPYPIPAPIILLWTVWHFRGLRGESVVAARRAEPQDLITQHDFQRVLGQVWAGGPKEALARVTAETGGGANGGEVMRLEPR
jgi:hypothetical protein